MVFQRIIFLCFAMIALPALADAPNDTQLAVWANEAIVTTYTYNYQNFIARQKQIAFYFNAQGWMNYSKALNDSKLPDVVQKNAYDVSAVATMPPAIKLLHDNYWQAIMPVLVVYKNPQYIQKQTLQITIEFTLAPSGQGVRGLAMASLQSKVIKPSCQCEADAHPTDTAVKTSN